MVNVVYTFGGGGGPNAYYFYYTYYNGTWTLWGQGPVRGAVRRRLSVRSAAVEGQSSAPEDSAQRPQSEILQEQYTINNKI